MSKYVAQNAVRYGLYAIAFLPIFIFRDFTPSNELRYLSIADEALKNGSIFTFTYHGLIYADKPPLYLWIIMLGKLFFGNHNMLFLGVFSFIPALVIVFIMDQWVKNQLTNTERLLGRLMLMTSGFFIGTAIVLRMDMLMCMFIVLSLYTFFRMYSGEGKLRHTILFPVFIFMAIFTKGPMGIIVPLVSTSVFLIARKEFRTIGKYWGWKTLSILILLCSFWFTGVYLEGGSQYLNNLLFNQTINRAVDSFHHKEAAYYYFGTIWYSLAPWSLLYLGVLVMGIKKKIVSTDMERFFLVIALTTFITLSLFSSKLAVYLLPTFPFIAYLAMLWLVKLKNEKWLFPLVGIPAVLLSLSFPAVILAEKFSLPVPLNTTPLIYIAAAILSLSGFITIKQLIIKNLNKGIGLMGLGILFSVFVVSFEIPKLNNIIGMGELCQEAKSMARQKGIENYYYYHMGRAESADVYLQKKPIKLIDEDLNENTGSIRKPAILFVRQKDMMQNSTLQNFAKGKNAYQVGNYYYIEID